MRETTWAPDSRTPRYLHELIYHMGGFQNYGPLLGPLDTRCRIILRPQKGTIILTTTHMPNNRALEQRTPPESEKVPEHGGLQARRVLPQEMLAGYDDDEGKFRKPLGDPQVVKGRRCQDQTNNTEPPNVPA